MIDEEGVARHRHDHLLGLERQSLDELKVVHDEVPSVSLVDVGEQRHVE